jgi:hypothetical protein
VVLHMQSDIFPRSDIFPLKYHFHFLPQ